MHSCVVVEVTYDGQCLLYQYFQRHNLLGLQLRLCHFALGVAQHSAERQVRGLLPGDGESHIRLLQISQAGRSDC